MKYLRSSVSISVLASLFCTTSAFLKSDDGLISKAFESPSKSGFTLYNNAASNGNPFDESTHEHFVNPWF